LRCIGKLEFVDFAAGFNGRRVCRTAVEAAAPAPPALPESMVEVVHTVRWPLQRSIGGFLR
jgi:hypothetical protein